MTKGYMTVEATMIMPVVFGLVLFVMSTLFYSYDRCLLEQDVTVFVVMGGYLQGESAAQRMDSLEKEIRNWYRDKYLWMNVEISERAVKADMVSITGEGEFVGPVYGSYKITREVYTLSPTFWLRQKEKLEELLENREDTDEDRIY